MLNVYDESSKRLRRGYQINDIANLRTEPINPIDMIQFHWPPFFRFQEKAYIDAFTQIIRKGRFF